MSILLLGIMKVTRSQKMKLSTTSSPDSTKTKDTAGLKQLTSRAKVLSFRISIFR
jgi:hypothetical protein